MESVDSRHFRSIFRSDLFQGQRILVTGGGTGIGRTIAHELASLGACVCIAGRRREKLERTAAEIAGVGGQVEILPLNIRDEGAVDEAIGSWIRDHGPLHGLVNNAGGQFASPAAWISPKGWRAVIDTNLNGTFWVTQAVFKHSMSEHGGAIVNIVADMWNGFPGMSHTGAARAAVVNLTQSLAVEWASCGVRINTVAPGFILSEGLNNYPEGVRELAAQVVFENPTSRLGTESEVSAAVVFLLSPAAAFINGASLRVDGAGSLQKAPMVPLSEHDRIPAFDGMPFPIEVPDIFRKRPKRP